MARTSGGAAGLMYAGTSTRPRCDSMATTSPSVIPKVEASDGFNSTQVCQVTLVTGSGAACSQGRWAHSPTPSVLWTNGTNTNGYVSGSPANSGSSRSANIGNAWGAGADGACASAF